MFFNTSFIRVAKKLTRTIITREIGRESASKGYSCERERYDLGQFHQRSTRSFYVCKFQMQLFCAYVLGLYFTGERLLGQKLHVECW